MASRRARESRFHGPSVASYELDRRRRRYFAAARTSPQAYDFVRSDARQLERQLKRIGSSIRLSQTIRLLARITLCSELKSLHR